MINILTGVIIYILYYLISVNKYDKDGHYKNKKLKNKKDIEENDYKKLPNEVKIFIDKYNIDISKINIRGLLKSVGFIIAFSIAFGLLIANRVSKIPIFQIAVTFLITLIFYFISLTVLGRYLKKKGYVKNGNKKNRK